MSDLVEVFVLQYGDEYHVYGTCGVFTRPEYAQRHAAEIHGKDYRSKLTWTQSGQEYWTGDAIEGNVYFIQKTLYHKD